MLLTTRLPGESPSLRGRVDGGLGRRGGRHVRHADQQLRAAWTRDDRPLTPIILWPDQRAVELEAEVQEQFAAAAFSATTGIPQVNHQFMPAKLLWLQQHRPETWAQMDRICLISDYLTLLLTGKHVTEAGAAGLTGLVDIHRCQWWPDMLPGLDLDQSCLPAIVPAGTDLGPIARRPPNASGCRSRAGSIVGCLDQYAGAIGVGNVEPGMISETTGTVLATVRCADRFSARLGPAVFQGPAFREGLYWQMAFGDVSANYLQWYRDQLPDRPDFEQLTALAEPIEPGAEGLRLRTDVGLTDAGRGFRGSDGPAHARPRGALHPGGRGRRVGRSGGGPFRRPVAPRDPLCRRRGPQRPVAADQGRRAGRGHGRHAMSRAHEPGRGRVGRGVARRRATFARSPGSGCD